MLGDVPPLFTIYSNCLQLWVPPSFLLCIVLWENSGHQQHAQKYRELSLWVYFTLCKRWWVLSEMAGGGLDHMLWWKRGRRRYIKKERRNIKKYILLTNLLTLYIHRLLSFLLLFLFPGCSQNTNTHHVISGTVCWRLSWTCSVLVQLSFFVSGFHVPLLTKPLQQRLDFPFPFTSQLHFLDTWVLNMKKTFFVVVV